MLSLGCVTARPRSKPDVEATMSRGGGLSALVWTVHLWRAGSRTAAEWQQSDVRRWQTVRLPSDSLSVILAALDSLAGDVPPIVPDTGTMQRLCGDTEITRLEVRRGEWARVAQESCPHYGAGLEAYWTRVNGLFDLLANAAQ
jgi:hypothetical protein